MIFIQSLLPIRNIPIAYDKRFLNGRFFAILIAETLKNHLYKEW